MSWLSYSKGEVSHFHPEFEFAANEALRKAGIHKDYEWIHHLRTPGNNLIPDFVLRKKDNHQWILAFEIKRTKEAVFSTRNQVQAKSYAELNQNAYSLSSPKYFAISNLESTVLFALNDNRPPLECRIEGGVYDSGSFIQDSKLVHRDKFIEDLMLLCQTVTQIKKPTFEIVWPGIIQEFNNYSDNLTANNEIMIKEPTTPHWDVVKDYFGNDDMIDSSRLFFFRCLMIEYLRGILIKYNHPNKSNIYPLLFDYKPNKVKVSVANSIDSLKQIDFEYIFEDYVSEQYRNLKDPDIQKALVEYVRVITSSPRKIAELVINRNDYKELLESLLDYIYPIAVQDSSGKIRTDPELAKLLAVLTIQEPVEYVIDPCCGDGSLISASYDRLVSLGISNQRALASIYGFEADSIAVKLAYLRLALKEPASLNVSQKIGINRADMFAEKDEISKADVILLNPPFKRYESQDKRPIPQELRDYYKESIELFDNDNPSTLSNQPNIYNYYVEYLIKAATNETKFGIILDNKWYQSNYGEALRSFLLQKCEIEAIIDYPHNIFFEDWAIATSILILKKTDMIDKNHKVKFIKCKTDPRTVDYEQLIEAYQQRNDWPLDWSCIEINQDELDPKLGWKTFFSKELMNDFRTKLPCLSELFEGSRQGRLDKEEGGVGILGLPFKKKNFGSRRKLYSGKKKRSFQTGIERKLTMAENDILYNLASKIPNKFRGNALINAGDLDNFELSSLDLSKNSVVEPPKLRGDTLYNGIERTAWTTKHEEALEEMKLDKDMGNFIRGVEEIANLNPTVLAKENLWYVLREPYAGELIIPRKTRTGHRVHVNPSAINPGEKQVRISSNFIAYKGCTAIDLSSNLDRLTAVRLIAAFLVSSFGQLQFEMEGYNREGLLALEGNQLNKIAVFDPRKIRKSSRNEILNVFFDLPYPIRNDRLSFSQSKRNRLDRLFAEEISYHFGFDKNQLLTEVQSALDEWIISRNP